MAFALKGCTLLSTRPENAGSVLSDRLRALGAEVIHFPVIAIRAPRSWKPVDRAIARLDEYGAVAFTSASAVEPFLRRLGGGGRLKGKRLCAVGPGTAAAMRKAGLRPRLIPPTATVERFAGFLAGKLRKGTRVLHPCADLANPVFHRTLECDDVVVYRIVSSRRKLPLRTAGMIDYTLLTSAEGVRRYHEAEGGRALKVPVVCIGPMTAKEAVKKGYRIAATAEPHTIDGLVKAVRKVWKR